MTPLKAYSSTNAAIIYPYRTNSTLMYFCAAHDIWQISNLKLKNITDLSLLGENIQ